MKSSDRLFFIHAGGGKTGSSALQSALAEATPDLAQIGISYAHAPQTCSAYTITSGNGLPLFNLLQSNDWSMEGERLLESYLEDRAVGICSGEHLGILPEVAWRRLFATADHCRIQIRVIFYVRPAASYLVACYNQEVKRAGECREMRDYLREGTWHHFDSLKILERVIPSEQLSVINYDVVRKDIVASFASAFPELAPTRTIMERSSGRTVNRSLDAIEIDVMRRVNACFGESFSEELSDRLIYSDPERRGGLSVTPDIAADLNRKFDKQTRWVNERFFPGSDACLGDLVPDILPDDPVRVSTPYAVALDWSLERLEATGGDAISHIRNQLLKIDWQNSEHHEIPGDFDPIAYLLLNNDLLRAGIKPFLHFIESGNREGRNYRWPVPLDHIGDPATGAAIIEARRVERHKQGEQTSYLRQLYQVEGLIHSFANREQSWLDELRREREAGKYARAELQNIVSSLGEEVITALQQSINKLAARQADHAGQIASLSENVTNSISAQSYSLSAFIEGLGKSNDALKEQGEQAGAALQSLSCQVQNLLQSIGDQQTKLIKQINHHEAEVCRQEGILSRYRNAGLWEFLVWSFWRRKRP